MTFVLFAAGTFWHYVFGIAMFLVSLFLILLVLVQRGRGGGLTGALGGMGGQSAFGAKAGDVFTRVTMVTAIVWVLLCMGSIWVLNSQDEWGTSENTTNGVSSPDGVDGADDQTGTSPDASGEGMDEGDSSGAGGIGASGDDQSDAAADTPTGTGGSEAPAAEAESKS
jgi:preprotein translocase subunit SecG